MNQILGYENPAIVDGTWMSEDGWKGSEVVKHFRYQFYENSNDDCIGVIELAINKVLMSENFEMFLTCVTAFE